MQLGKLGVWQFTDGLTAAEAAAFAQRVEKWGYSALWIPEATGREPFAHAAWLLANTQKLIIATGIANIYARDARASANGQATLAEQSGGRFLLGLGVSHVPLVEGVRGHKYGAPVATMKAYLEDMKSGTPFTGRAPAEAPPTVIAALGPKMLELAKTHTGGAHPYLVTPEHTAMARKIMGPDAMLCVEQKILGVTDPVRARDVARKAVAFYLALPNYRNNLLRLGFSAGELDGQSDRVTDALVAWGDTQTIRKRIDAHFAAGASHVCIQAIPADGSRLPDEALLAALAPAA
ncbi:MAG: TIGR03620 family F420-dependent LLM class oxidoreductase [Alphaproteobacteria bacterium]|nr:TIGR03620 family F420-dependent LLM class oxidoreductase [Alphaproteobacteria bacterium]